MELETFLQNHPEMKDAKKDLESFMKEYWGRLEYGNIRPPDFGFCYIEETTLINEEREGYKNRYLEKGGEISWIVVYEHITESSSSMLHGYNPQLEMGWRRSCGGYSRLPPDFDTIEEMVTALKAYVQDIPRRRKEAIMVAMDKETLEYGWFHGYFDGPNPLPKLSQVHTPREIALIKRLYRKKLFPKQ
jgi:hypothetical protein